MARLQNKVAVITASGSGQGRAAALLFAQEGARVGPGLPFKPKIVNYWGWLWAARTSDTASLLPAGKRRPTHTTQNTTLLARSCARSSGVNPAAVRMASVSCPGSRGAGPWSTAPLLLKCATGPTALRVPNLGCS